MKVVTKTRRQILKVEQSTLASDFIKNSDFKQLFESLITNKHLTANTSSPA